MSSLVIDLFAREKEKEIEIEEEERSRKETFLEIKKEIIFTFLLGIVCISCFSLFLSFVSCYFS